MRFSPAGLLWMKRGSFKTPRKKEITMTQNKQIEQGGRPTTVRKRNRYGHWLRVAVMFMSGGFVFPHAMSEDSEETTEIYRDKSGKGKTG
jgi:hypothetical protein